MAPACEGWLASPPTEGGAPLRMFCFPHAGGGAQVFKEWGAMIGARIDVCPIELPGRGRRFSQQPLASLSALVLATAAALGRHAKAPFVLFGHSMGALLAFELARELRRSCGLTPEHLFVAAHRAPQLPLQAPIHELPEPAFVQRLRQLGEMPPEVLANGELFALLQPALRADLHACEAYTFAREAPLECPITALGGLEDTTVQVTALDPWREHTTERFALRMLPGGHFFVRTARRQLLTLIADDLWGHTDAAP